MKLLMIFVDADRTADVERLLDASDIPGYSEFPGVLGRGATGRKLGSRAFPGTSNLYLVALREGSCAGLCDELAALRKAKGPEEGLRVYVLDALEVV